jgi:ABC-type sugar transport system substrate-binding protein
MVACLATAVAVFGSAASPASSKTVTAAAANGAAAAKADADAVVAKLGSAKLPAITVGLNQIIGSNQSATHVQTVLQTALKAIGWKVVVCDAEGDPTKMANCETTLLNEGVKAIFSIGEESSVIAAGLQQAKAQGIPTFNIGGVVTPSPLFTGNYGPNEEESGQILAKWVEQKLGPAGGDIIHSTYPAYYSVQRDKGLTALVAADPKLKVVDTTTLDFANLEAGTTQQVTAMLTAYPQAKVYWNSAEASIEPAAAAVKSVEGGKVYPNAPLVVTFHADLSTQVLIREGEVSAVSDNPNTASAWVAVDSAAEYIARHKADPSPGYTVDGFPIYDYVIITKSNLPPAGQYVPPTHDYADFFTEKWKKEFGR